MFLSTRWIIAIGGVMSVLLLGACQGDATPAPVNTAAEIKDMPAEQLIILGDIDPDEPTKKIKRFNPLAAYLAEHLTEFGIKGGRVVIARDIEEMAGFLKDGTVDIYFDSAYPTLATQELSGSEIILRRWKEGISTYWSLLIALSDGGVTGVDDLRGKLLAFEEPRSTSGFLLPAGTLAQRGLKLREVDGPSAPVGAHEIGYFFSGDEENTLQLILERKVAGGGVSNQDYDELPEELKQRIIVIARTSAVPRQLVSLASGLDPGLARKVQELLVGLELTKEGRDLLEGIKQTIKFDPLPPDSQAALQELKEIMVLFGGGQ